MTNIDDSKELFDYWHRRVKLMNNAVLTSQGHIPTYKLRHECTNYDSLRASNEVRILNEPERSQVIAVIKYECTAQALQKRAEDLRGKAHKLEDSVNELNRKKQGSLNLLSNSKNDYLERMKRYRSSRTVF